MKRVEVNSFEELTDFLHNDSEKTALCPLRFINVESLDMWVKVKKYLDPMVGSNIHLSSHCSHDDTFPILSKLKKELISVTTNVCVLPLSEALRLIDPDTAKKFITQLISANYSGNNNLKLRIYIPMYRMSNILNTISINDPRKDNCIIMLASDKDQNYSLTIIQDDLKVNLGSNEISGFKQYFHYWENNPDKRIILRTAHAKDYRGDSFFDNIRVIVTAFDLLTEYYHIPTCYKESDGIGEYWNQLADAVAKRKDFESACRYVLNTDRFVPDLFDRWADFDEFKRWVLWLWVREKRTSSYLRKCISESKNVDEFKEFLYTKIVELLGDSRFNELYSERKKLLLAIKPSVPSSFFERIKQLQGIDQLRVLTDITEPERKRIFELLKGVSDISRSEAISVLKMTYPALYNYLHNSGDNIIEEDLSEVEGENILDYFDQYRWYKAANVLPITFNERVKEIAHKKGSPVYSLNTRNYIVAEEYDDATTIIFVDGMGVDYINYIWAVLGQLKIEGYEIRTRVGYCNLPSTTGINKDFLANRKCAEELSGLDAMKHENNEYPATIENELKFLDSLNDKVKYAFKPGIKRVILTSDHGTSRMAVLIRDTQFDNKHSSEGHNIYKYGRYCEGTDMAKKFDTAIEYNGKLIFADYQRFIQKGAPANETHGGASLEEWLVPIIIIDKLATDEAKLVINIIPPTEQLKVDPTTQIGTVKFSLEDYHGNDVFVHINRKKITCKLVNNQYEFEYSPGGETDIEANVYVGTRSIGKFKFTVKQGILENPDMGI